MHINSAKLNLFLTTQIINRRSKIEIKKKKQKIKKLYNQDTNQTRKVQLHRLADSSHLDFYYYHYKYKY